MIQPPSIVLLATATLMSASFLSSVVHQLQASQYHGKLGCQTYLSGPFADVSIFMATMHSLA